MKNFSDIQNLLDRYWEGETTLEEERTLKAYFNSGEVDERLQAVAPLFQAIREEQTLQYAKTKTVELRPVHFAWQKWAAAASVALLLSAGLWWNSQQDDDVVAEQVVQQPTEQPAEVLPKKDSVSEENKIAEAEEVKPTVTVKKAPVKRKKTPVAEPSPEAEVAMEEIKAALALVSSKMKKGREEASKGAIHLENVDKVFKKKEG
jgi:hypothetical protein